MWGAGQGAAGQQASQPWWGLHATICGTARQSCTGTFVLLAERAGHPRKAPAACLPSHAAASLLRCPCSVISYLYDYFQPSHAEPGYSLAIQVGGWVIRAAMHTPWLHGGTMSDSLFTLSPSPAIGALTLDRPATPTSRCGLRSMLASRRVPVHAAGRQPGRAADALARAAVHVRAAKPDAVA